MTSAPISTLADIVRVRALMAPDRVALRILRSDLSERESVSYAQLDHQARAVGRELAGLAPGSRVLLLAPDALDYIAGLFGASRAGLTPVSGVTPFAPRASAGRHAGRLDRFRSVVETSGARAVIGPGELLSQFERALAGQPASGLSFVPIDGLTDEAVGEVHQDLLADPSSLALLQYTSGSTGPPGGVALSHANIIANLAAQETRLGLTPDDVGVSWLPLFHDFGLIGAVLVPLYVGFPCVLLPPAGFLERPRRWLEAMSSYGATVSWAPNFAYRRCVTAIEHGARADLNLHTWRLAVNAAEPVGAETVREFSAAFAGAGLRASAVYPCYGLAEATLAVTAPDPGESVRTLRLDRTALGEGRVVDVAESAQSSVELVGCGRPLPDLAVAIVHPQTCEPAADSEVGEIWVAGPSVAQGYFGDQERTGSAFGARLPFDRRSWLRTGDLGFLRDGCLYISGRLKDLIILRGVNIYPQGLEATAVRSHLALGEVAACAFSALADGEEALVIVCEIRRGWTGDAAEAADSIRRAVFTEHGLETYAVALVRTGGLLMTPSGKVQRQACRAAFLGRTMPVIFESRVKPTSLSKGAADGWGQSPNTDISRAGPPTPATHSAEGQGDDQYAPLVRWIFERLAALAPGSEIRDETYLADLGLNSVDITELAADLEDRFGLRIAAAELYELRSLSDLLALLAGSPAS
ncbi:MAG: AMP-binding protein [Caulobacterales bacterium]